MRTTQNEIRQIVHDLVYIKTKVESLKNTCHKDEVSKETGHVLTGILDITLAEMNEIVSVLERTADELER